MDEDSLTPPEDTTPRLIVRFRASDWDALNQHLFPGDHDEHGAALLCGQAHIDGELRLLVREVIPATDGRDYVPGTLGYRHLTGAFVTRQLRRAKKLGLVYLAVHNHGGHDKVAFSQDDMDSHERGYPTLLNLNNNPVGALVLTPNAVAGDIWHTSQTRAPVDFTVITGDAHAQLTDGSQPANPTSPAAPQYGRQALMFGDAGQQLLAQTTVAIVGAGGVGMLIIQALALLGVGHLIVVDPDHITTSNLSRLPEARPRDATGGFSGLIGKLARRLGWGSPTMKVELGRRIAKGANSNITYTGIAGDIGDDRAARAITGTDFIFLAADTMLARDVVNQIAYQYLIPTLQVGSKIVVDPTTGNVTDTFGVVRSLGTQPGCLRCNGLVNMRQLSEEQVATDEQRRNQRYIDEPGIDAPSVITLNAMATGWAVNDFLHYITGLGRPSQGYRILRSRPIAANKPQLTVQEPHQDPDCYVCGTEEYSILSKGDGADLPTRLGR